MLPPPLFFRALGDRTRLRIVNLLGRGPLCVCDIQFLLRQPQSSVSRHLALLRTTGLVRDRRDGMRTFYELGDWAAGFQQGVLETLRRDLKAETEYGRDLRELDALKDAGECHVEGSARGPRAAAVARIRGRRSSAVVLVTHRKRPTSRVRAQR